MLTKTRMVRATGISGMLGRMTEESFSDEVVDVLDVSDPIGPQNGQYRCVRGGSWDSVNPDFFRCAYRYRNYPGFRINYVGFRLSAGPG